MCYLTTDEVRLGLGQPSYSVTEGVDSEALVCITLDRPLERNGVVVRFNTDDVSAIGTMHINTLQPFQPRDNICLSFRWAGL